MFEFFMDISMLFKIPLLKVIISIEPWFKSSSDKCMMEYNSISFPQYSKLDTGYRFITCYIPIFTTYFASQKLAAFKTSCLLRK